MRTVFFLPQLSHSPARAKSLFLVQTLIPTGQDSAGWEKRPVSGKKLDSVSLEDAGLCHIVHWGLWFQEGLKCVQFPRTSLQRKGSYKPVVEGPRGASRRPPASGVTAWQPCCFVRRLPGECLQLPPPGPQHLARAHLLASAGAGSGQPTPEQLWCALTPRPRQSPLCQQCPAGGGEGGARLPAARGAEMPAVPLVLIQAAWFVALFLEQKGVRSGPSTRVSAEASGQPTLLPPARSPVQGAALIRRVHSPPRQPACFSDGGRTPGRCWAQEGAAVAHPNWTRRLPDV